MSAHTLFSRIKVDLPDIKGRKETFLVHLKELNCSDDCLSCAFSSLSMVADRSNVSLSCSSRVFLQSEKARTAAPSME